MLKIILVTVFIAAPFTAMAQTSSENNAQPSGDAGRGKTLFISDGCSECHGTVGQGGVGPHLAPKPLPAEAIASYIRHPAGVMPPYAASVLSDADVADIASYLRSVPAPPKLGSLPELND